MLWMDDLVIALLVIPLAELSQIIFEKERWWCWARFRLYFMFVDGLRHHHWFVRKTFVPLTWKRANVNENWKKGLVAKLAWVVKSVTKLCFSEKGVPCSVPIESRTLLCFVSSECRSSLLIEREEKTKVVSNIIITTTLENGTVGSTRRCYVGGDDHTFVVRGTQQQRCVCCCCCCWWYKQPREGGEDANTENCVCVTLQDGKEAEDPQKESTSELVPQEWMLERKCVDEQICVPVVLTVCALKTLTTTTNEDARGKFAIITLRSLTLVGREDSMQRCYPSCCWDEAVTVGLHSAHSQYNYLVDNARNRWWWTIHTLPKGLCCGQLDQANCDRLCVCVDTMRKEKIT